MFARICLILAVILFGSMPAGCASGIESLPELSGPATPEYRLAAGDAVRIVVPGLTGVEATNNATFAVNDRGEISVPILGSVEANGRTVPELEQAIAQKLIASEILVSPSVSVQPAQLRPVYVTGEVGKPGNQPYTPGLSVLAAVATAGGYTFRAKQGEVALIRIVNGKSVRGRVGEDFIVQPGDTIKVYEKWF